MGSNLPQADPLLDDATVRNRFAPFVRKSVS
jgi:hypothetical protein